MGLLVPNFGKGGGIGECGVIRFKLHFLFFLAVFVFYTPSCFA